MDIEIKHAPVDKREEIKTAILQASLNSKGALFNNGEVKALMDKIMNVVDSKGENGKIEEIKYEGQDRGVVFQIDDPFVSVKTYDRNDDSGKSIVLDKHTTREIANILLLVCDQIERR